jgi:type I restriction-modification system DNA methylase subunit
VFRDFVAVCAIWMSIGADPGSRRDREDEYNQIVARYTEDDVQRFARGFAHVSGGLANDFRDFLGETFMAMDLENRQQGQFFTPFDLSLLLAELQMDSVRKSCEKNGFTTFCDPCVGAGSMLIACAKVMRDKGLNFQKQMHATAIDADIVAVHMAYVQFSLLHIPAIVIHGNALTGNAHSEWRTLAHAMGRWDLRLTLESAFAQLDRVHAQFGSATTPQPK